MNCSMRPRWESSPVEAGAPPVENESSSRKSWVPSVGDGVPSVRDGVPINTNPRQTRLWESGKEVEKTCLRTGRVRISSQQWKKAEKQKRVLKNSVLPYPRPIFSSGEPWSRCQFVLQASRSFRFKQEVSTVYCVLSQEVSHALIPAL